MGKKWTKDKIWEFKEMYEDPDICLEEIAQHFNLKLRSVYSTANKYKFKRSFYYQEGYLKCIKCKAILSFDEFHKNKSSYSSRQSKCKDCCSKNSTKKISHHTKSQIDFVINNYSNTTYTVRDIAQHLNITTEQLKNLVARLRKKGINIKYRSEKRR